MNEFQVLSPEAAERIVRDLRAEFGILWPIAPPRIAQPPVGIIGERYAILAIVQDYWNQALSDDDDVTAEVLGALANEIKGRGI